MIDSSLTHYESGTSVCERLDIKAQTLYAYVSRGYLRTKADPADSRKRLYLSTDVDRVLERKTRGRSRQAIAASTIDAGEPILSSSLTQIRDGQFYYREENAVTLSNSLTLEQVFCSLCDIPESRLEAPQSSISSYVRRTPFTRMLETASQAAINTKHTGTRSYAYQILCSLASSAVGKPYQASVPIHEFLAGHWSKNIQAPDLIRQALVLCADHELNASTYACRVAASAGASLSASVLVGLATLSGTRHGDLTNQCLRWMNKIATKPKLARQEILKLNHSPPPGFGQPLYPHGDPRAIAILGRCLPDDRWNNISKLVFEMTGAHPSLDYGLAVLEKQLEMPKGAGLGIFALGRSVGWMAHCFEQRNSGKIIRPRASVSKNQTVS